LEYIKKQKLKIRKLEKAQEENSAATNGAQKEQISATATTVSSFSSDGTVFWDLLGRSSPFQINLAKAALTSLVNVLKNSTLGQQKLPTKANLFRRWKMSHMEERLKSSQCAHEESLKTISSLEQRNAKLKLLLSKTHQANQRNMENTQTMKKAQRDALLELKSMKQRDESERTRLIETLRLQNIESAFHSDLELSIQKAAEELFLQHQKLLQQKQLSQQHTQFGGGDSENTFDSNGTNICSNEMLEIEQTNKMIRISELEVEIDALRSHCETSKAENSSLKSRLDNLTQQIHSLEHEVQSSRRRADEEESLRKELEVEIHIVLANREVVMREMSIIAEGNAQKRNADLVKELETATASFSLLQAEKNNAQERFLKAESEANVLRTRIKKMTDQTEEIHRLQNIVSDLKAVKFKGASGVSSSHSPSKRGSGPRHSRKKESVENCVVSTELLSSVNDLFEASREAARASELFAELVGNLEGQLRRSENKNLQRIFHLSSLCQEFSSLVEESFNAGMILHESPNNEHIHQRRKYKKSVEQCILEIDAKLAALTSESVALRQQTLSQPLVWEASSLTIPPGRNVTILLPCSSFLADSQDLQGTFEGQKKKLALDWTYSGEFAGNISLALSSVSSKGGSETKSGGLMLFSVQTHNAKSVHPEFCGRHPIPLAQSASSISGSEGPDKVLAFQNNTMWAVKIAYKVTLSNEDAVITSDSSTKSKMQEIETLLARKRKLLHLLERGKILISSFSSLSKELCMAEHLRAQPVEQDLVASSPFTPASAKTSKTLYQQQHCKEQLQIIEGLIAKVNQLIAPKEENRKETSEACKVGGGSDVFDATRAIQGGSTQAGEYPLYLQTISSESVIVRAADEMRFRLPLPVKAGVTDTNFSLSYEVCLPHSHQRLLDVGFAVLEELKDGSLPQLVPYRRLSASSIHGKTVLFTPQPSAENVVLLFDNTYSFFKPKEIKYRASIQELQVDTRPSRISSHHHSKDGEGHEILTLHDEPQQTGTATGGESTKAINGTPPRMQMDNDELAFGKEHDTTPQTLDKKRTDLIKTVRDLSILLDEGVLLTAKRKGE